MASPRGLDQVAFIAVKRLGAATDDAWEDWLRECIAHHNGALWSLLDPAPPGMPGAGHSHVIHLPTPELAAYEAEVADDRLLHDALRHVEIERECWRRHGAAIALDPDADPTGLIVAEVTSADPRHHDEWDAWYDEQHLPDMMASDAFIAGTRWKRELPRPGSANFLTVYEISGITTSEAIERSAAAIGPLIAAGRKHRAHAGGRTWALERCG